MTEVAEGQGTAGNLISLTRTGASGKFTLSAPSGVISVNYLNISNSIATGGATWNAFTTSGFIESARCGSNGELLVKAV